MLNNKYTELIAKKLSKDITKAEEQMLDDWLQSSVENQEDYKIYSSFWSDLKIKRISNNADNIFVGISAAIQEEELGNQEEYHIPEKSSSLSYLWRGIAATLLVLVVAVFVYKGMTNKEELPVVQSIQMIEKSLPVGQKMKIFLPDGSAVWLNAESSISYPKRFDGERRIVTLKGEAFFDIRRNPSKPFVVKTQKMDVVVLGTKFNVRNFDNEGKTDVALESGKVMVEISGLKSEKHMLLPGEGLSLSKNSGKIGKYIVEPRSAYQWKDGVIYFHNTGFDEVINKLSRWYGVEFNVENYDGRKWEYSAEFKNDNLSNILQSMSFTKGFEFELDQNKVTLKFN